MVKLDKPIIIKCSEISFKNIKRKPKIVKIKFFNSDKYLLSYEDLWDLKFNQFFKDGDENAFKLAIKKFLVKGKK